MNLISATQCSPITTLNNGQVNVTRGSGTNYGSVVKFECDPEFDLIGNPVLLCKTGGQWSGAEPVCQSKCPALIIIFLGNMNIYD